MERAEIRVEKRDILGKDVRFLRRSGIVPAHLFGHGIDSLPVQLDRGTLQKLLIQSGRTGIVNLRLGGESQARPVIIREVQKSPSTGEVLHVDFYQVRMQDKVEVEVPLVFTGEAPALKDKENMLLRELDTLTVECLPANIPPEFEVSLDSLEEAEQAIRVEDLKLSSDCTVLNAPEQVVVKVAHHAIEKPVEKAAEEVTPETTTEARTGETEERGASPA